MIYRDGSVSGHSVRQGGLRWRRVAPIVGAAVLAFAGGALLGGRHVASSQRIAERFAAAWQQSDLAAMYALTDASASGRPLREFAQAYRDAEVTATATRVRFGEARADGDNTYTVPATVTTRAFVIAQVGPPALRLTDSGSGGATGRAS